MSDAILEILRHVPAWRPAIDDGTQRLRYGDLRRLIAAEKRWLDAGGVRRCALHADNGASWVLTDLALLASGAVNVPLPGYFSAAQTQHVLDDAGIEFVLTDQHAQFAHRHPEFSRAGTSDRTGLVLMRRELRADARAIPADVVKITYTSGSTGEPKGVCLSAASMLAVAQSLADATAQLEVTRHLCLLPLATLLENIAGIYAALLLGAQTTVKPSRSTGMNYAGVNVALLLDSIVAAAPESLVLVPELLRVLVHATRQGWASPALKFIAVGGASVSAELLQQAQDAGLPVFQGYGLSECSSVVCLNTSTANRPGSVGRPLPHARVRIDSNGEICVAGAVMSGYLGDSHTVQQEIRTGDLGEIDADGYLYVHGRAKNMFITSMGRNIAPEWVERELTSEPAIAQAMVLGEGRPYAAALIAAYPGTSCEAIDQAIGRANARLPEYAHVMAWTAFPELPLRSSGLLTANGRLRRDAILARFAACIEPLYASSENFLHVVS